MSARDLAIFYSIFIINVGREKPIKNDFEDTNLLKIVRMLKKFIYCTGIMTIIFIKIYLLIKYEYLNLRYIIS